MDNTELNQKVGLNQEDNRDQFQSKFGFIMAAAGSAVGLGNIWKFPYMTGENGGGAFVLIYLISAALIGISLLIVEFAIGRNSGASAVEAYGKYNKKYKFVGFFSMIAVTVLFSYYNIIGGWTIYYFIQSITGNLIGLNAEEISAGFNSFTTNVDIVAVFGIIFLAITAFVVLKGISGGIEKACTVLMPALFIMLIVLAVRSVTLPGAAEGIKWYLKPDFSQVTSSTFVAALGQVFFSLSLGSGGMVTYASYLNKKENIPFAASVTAISGTAVGILAGLAILPAVFAFGLSPGEGPGLAFVTLPNVFGQMPFGSFFSAVFFLLFFFAALTSSISMLEVSVTYILEKTKMSRKSAVLVMCLIILLLATPPLMSYGSWGDIKIFGKNFFDLYDYFVSNISFPLVGLAGALIISHVWNEKDLKDEITNTGEIKFGLYKFWYSFVKYIIPILLVILFLTATGILNI
ncbi:sodium-dependent transporter [Schnuerera sp. xch1]|uniref:sodium-dependent transporter n=1 Tax=Schnuerera sp. xch1 TaxID=2874283 RepID=UPI001CBF69F6|nr:sodium-dependent transporter [Schnuerera sp. xch1]MBZ2174883.1 sodium-dependent transporter [Schnuerera sp. xch1]